MSVYVVIMPALLEATEDVRCAALFLLTPLRRVSWRESLSQQGAAVLLPVP